MEILWLLGGLTLGIIGVVLLRGGGGDDIGARFIDGIRALLDARALGTLAGARGGETWYLNLRDYDETHRSSQ
ncbi:hypothetical protein JGI2_00605 [Candidatus Kryptobacter tengchongensis]|nr:hypothetical protein JGI2_00605 [Candidatus Kryptobacter tengchongensis]